MRRAKQDPPARSVPRAVTPQDRERLPTPALTPEDRMVTRIPGTDFTVITRRPRGLRGVRWYRALRSYWWYKSGRHLADTPDIAKGPDPSQ